MTVNAELLSREVTKLAILQSQLDVNMNGTDVKYNTKENYEVMIGSHMIFASPDKELAKEVKERLIIQLKPFLDWYESVMTEKITALLKPL